MATLDWNFFTPETLDCLFVIYEHKMELNWAETMWRHLERTGLTQYSTAYQYNAVLARLAMLAHYWKCWEWQADYSGSGDPGHEHADWLEALPFIRSVQPFSELPKESLPSKPPVNSGAQEIMSKLISRENDVVFDAVMRFYGDDAEFGLGLALRHAAGKSDDFGSHVRFNEYANDIAEQEKWFKEYGFSMREFDALSFVQNRFVY